jgi:hypothetical protein
MHSCGAVGGSELAAAVLRALPLRSDRGEALVAHAYFCDLLER